MEVNPNRRATEVAKTVVPSLAKPAPKAPPANTVMFKDSENLNQALQRIPDVRSDKVAQAGLQAKDAQYPPLATIRAIAHLLAVNLDESKDSKGNKDS